MDTALQNPTKKIERPTVDVVPIPYSELPFQQQEWVDYCSLQGLITNDDGSMTKMTIEQCAQRIGVHRTTLYEWKKTIPNFQDLVNERCALLFSGPRTTKVVNSIYLAATVKLNAQAQAMWMANQRAIEFRMPTQEVKHEVGSGFADLIASKRINQPSERKIIDATQEQTNS